MSSRKVPRIITIVLAGAGIATLFFLTGSWIPGIDILFHIATGWAAYVGRVASQVHVRLDLLITAVIYAAALLVGSHLFLRWLYREMGGTSLDGRRIVSDPWRWKWTISGFALVILMFTSGIAAIGVIHQTNVARPVAGTALSEE